MRLFSFTHTPPDKCSQTLLRSPVRHSQEDLFPGIVLELCRVLSVPVCTRCCGACHSQKQQTHGSHLLV